MSVAPLSPDDREKARRIIRGVYGRSTMDADRTVAALEASGWTLLPPGTASIEDDGPHPWDSIPHWRVVGPWTPQEGDTE